MKNTLKKPLSAYSAVILDMDGTLYFQAPVRFFVLLDMLLHFWSIREFLIIQKYRKLYERGLTDHERFAKLPSDAPHIVNKWMLLRPMKYVRKFRDRALLSLIKTLHSKNIRIIVYSDYPLKNKLEATDLEPDFAYYAGDEIISCQKPDPKGLLNIIADLGEKPENIAFIGDRYEKDGLCADNAGVDCVILPKSVRRRCEIYKIIGGSL